MPKKRVNVEDEEALAEIKIERALTRLQKKTGRTISFVRVDLENFDKPTVEIFSRA